MIKKSERLKLIIELQVRQEQDALQALGRSQQKLLEQLQQLDQLQKYNSDYNASLADRQKTGMNVNQLLELRSFAEKLENAIEGQQQAVSIHEQDLLRTRKYWEEKHQRTKSLKKISDIALAEELKLENKREQIEQDQRAARSHRKTAREMHGNDKISGE